VRLKNHYFPEDNGNICDQCVQAGRAITSQGDHKGRPRVVALVLDGTFLYTVIWA